MPRGQIDNIGEFHKRYSHCKDRQWVPSQKSNDKVSVDTIITAWKNIVGISNLVSNLVYGQKNRLVYQQLKNIMYANI